MQPSIPACLQPSPNKIPLKGIYDRCPHGQMLLNHGSPNYCWLCRPYGTIEGKGKFIMPDFGRAMSENDSLRANKHEPGMCPTCGDGFRIQRDDLSEVCANCGEALRPTPKKRSKRPLAHVRTIPAR